MSFADHVFHNGYLCEDIFSHAPTQRRYYGIRGGNGLARRGLLKLLQLKTMCKNDLQFTPIAMNLAAMNGHLETVKWLHENRTEGCTTYAMDWAAEYGHIDMVQWLHENRTEGCTTYAMDSAAENGHLETVQWLDANRTEGCTVDAMDCAAGYGHLQVVKWLCENRTEGYTGHAIRKTRDAEIANLLNNAPDLYHPHP